MQWELLRVIIGLYNNIYPLLKTLATISIPTYKNISNLHSNREVEYLEAEEGQQMGGLAARGAVNQHERDSEGAHCNQCTHIHII